VGKVNKHIKYDLQVFWRNGVRLAGVVGDSMVADYLLRAGERGHNMEVLSLEYLQHRPIPISDLIGKGKSQKRMDEVPPAQVAVYAGEDADVAWRLCALLEPLLQNEKWLRSDTRRGTTGLAEGFYLYDDLEVPLIEVLADMEFSGIRLDVPFLQRMSGELGQALERLEEEIYQLAGRKFNIASVKQLREVLYGDLGYKSSRKTAVTGAASTDQETLEKLAKEGLQLPIKLLEQRQIAKLKGTYVDALPALVNESTGRVHASFNQTVAATGRLSSSDPNLQNIPIRTEMGEQIRQAFLPAEGWELLAADYSQIELRLLAHFCEDEELRRAFAEDRDIHARVAAQVFGVEENLVTSQMRRMAKTINFGIIYGISAFGLAQRLEISQEEASKFIDAYFARYPKVQAYQDGLLARCLTQGFVDTILGRKRRIQGVRLTTSYRNRNQPEREAINMQIQGSAADLIKVAMLNIHRRLEKEGRQTKLLLQIHDELVLEVPPAERADMVRLVHQEMTGALADRLHVPIKVDMAIGKNWLDAQEVTI
jgi:DNA polymerase-1